MERTLAAAVAVALTLAACGDGGGSEPKPLDSDAAVALTDSAPPGETVANQAARSAAIFDRIDSLIVSAVYAEFRGEGLIFAADCRETRCRFTEPRTRRSITITFGDLRNTDPGDARPRAVLTKNGVTLVETRGRFGDAGNASPDRSAGGRGLKRA